MVLEFPYCSFKCDKESGTQICQNRALSNERVQDINCYTLCERYINNPITSAVVMQGLEPMDSFDDVLCFIGYLRGDFRCSDDVVIYTGYNENEIADKLSKLKQYDNIIVKFGRFVPNDESTFDSVLEVNLASKNQYAKQIS